MAAEVRGSYIYDPLSRGDKPGKTATVVVLTLRLLLLPLTALVMVADAEVQMLRLPRWTGLTDVTVVMVVNGGRCRRADASKAKCNCPSRQSWTVVVTDVPAVMVADAETALYKGLR